MATSYTTLLGMALPVTGELQGTWGTTVNSYITEYVDSAVAGTQTISGSQTAVTLSKTTGASLTQAGSGATGSSQFAIINCTGNPAGLLTITAPAASQSYLVINGTSTSQSVKIVGAGPTTGVTLISGEKALVAWNGSDFVKVATAGGSSTFYDLTVTNSATLSYGTANGVAYLNGSKVLTTGSALTFDGSALVLTSSNISYAQFSSLSANGSRIEVKDGGSLVGYIGNGANSIGSASATQFCVNGTSNIIFGITGNAKATLSATSLSLDSTVSMTVNSGTANGVAYLNGSKVLTTGSALTFDGTNFASTGIITSTNANGLRAQYPSSASYYAQLDSRDGNTYLSAVGSTAAIVFSATNGPGTTSEGMRLTSTGLGIGTSSPAKKLDVRQTYTADTVVAQIGNIGNGNGATPSATLFDFTVNNGVPVSRIGSVYTQAIGQAYLSFSTYSGGSLSEKMQLDASGNLGIGTTNPSAYGLVAVNGASASVNINATTGAAAFKLYEGAGTGRGSVTSLNGANGLAFLYGTTEGMRLDSSGNLGIGTSSPGYKLDVAGTMGVSSSVTLSGGTANGVAYLNGSKVLTTGSALTFDGTILQSSVSTSGEIFRTIGTGSAAYVSSVFQNTNAGGYVQQLFNVGASGASGQAAIQYAPGIFFSMGTVANDASTPLVWKLNGSEQMRLTSTGLGIGTSSPDSKLTVVGATAGTGPAGLRIGYNGTSVNYIDADTQYFRTGAGSNSLILAATTQQYFISGSEQMRLTSTGLGIGTSSPGFKLDVNGIGAVRAGNAVRYYRADNAIYTELYDAGASGFTLNNANGNGFRFQASGSTQATLDSSGNLGLGVTPSAWGASFKALEIGGAGTGLFSGTGTTPQTYLTANAYFNGTNWIYKGSAAAARYSQSASGHEWSIAASGTAGNAITFTQAMTLDASGQLALGRTSVTDLAANVRTVDMDGTAGAGFRLRVNGTATLNLYTLSSAAYMAAPANIPIVFETNNTERARITSGGDFLVGKTATGGTVGIELLPNGYVRAIRSSSTTDTTLDVYSTGASAYRFYVEMSGTVYATNTTISAISDIRFKENVRDLDDGLNIVMALKPRKFDWKAGKGKDIKNDRGFIAQEYEQVLPDLIDEWKDPAPEGEDPYKSVRQDLIPVLVKAMQEQQVMINELKAKVAALEAK